jgi:hypothetical protein
MASPSSYESQFPRHKTSDSEKYMKAIAVPAAPFKITIRRAGFIAQ